MQKRGVAHGRFHGLFDLYGPCHWPSRALLLVKELLLLTSRARERGERVIAQAVLLDVQRGNQHRHADGNTNQRCDEEIEDDSMGCQDGSPPRQPLLHKFPVPPAPASSVRPSTRTGRVNLDLGSWLQLSRDERRPVIAEGQSKRCVALGLTLQILRGLTQNHAPFLPAEIALQEHQV